MTFSNQTLVDFIEAYTPSIDEKKVISFVSLRSARKWDNGQFKVFYTLTMRDDVYTDSIIDFPEECLLDTIFVFNEWLEKNVAEKNGNEEQSSQDEANQQLEHDFYKNNN